MPRFITRPDVTIEADVSTGPQVVGTPWGMHPVRAGDVLVPDGDHVVPIPARMLAKWAEPDGPKPTPKPVPELPTPRAVEGMTRKQLEDVAEEHGIEIKSGARVSAVKKQMKAALASTPERRE